MTSHEEPPTEADPAGVGAATGDVQPAPPAPVAAAGQVEAPPESTPLVAVPGTGLSSSLAAGVDQLDGGAFSSQWAKGFVVLLLGHLERQLDRTAERLRGFEEREQGLREDLTTERIATAVLKEKVARATSRQRTQNLLFALGGTLLGTGLAAPGSLPGYWTVVLAVLGLALLGVAWGM